MSKKKILLITYDNCDDSEVLYPLFRMREAGYTVDVASMEKRTIKAKYHFTVDVTLLLDEVDPSEYAGLILPGGTAPEKIRQQAAALEITKIFRPEPPSHSSHLPRSADTYQRRHTARQKVHLLPRDTRRSYKRRRTLRKRRGGGGRSARHIAPPRGPSRLHARIRRPARKKR